MNEQLKVPPMAQWLRAGSWVNNLWFRDISICVMSPHKISKSEVESLVLEISIDIMCMHVNGWAGYHRPY